MGIGCEPFGVFDHVLNGPVRPVGGCMIDVNGLQLYVER